jgi:O-antigen biosynthesis protein
MNLLKTYLKTKLATWSRERLLSGLLAQYSFFLAGPAPTPQNGARDIVGPQLNIAFIIPGLTRFSGGHTSILRIGTFLAELGHTISYITYDNSQKDAMERNAKANLSYYRGNILAKDALVALHFDVGIATFWPSAYVLHSSPRFSYKAYYIQDYEPLFYRFGDEYLWAKQSYELGLHNISLGIWNKQNITQRDGSIVVDCIDFPYEPREYPLRERTISIRDDETIKIAVYLKMDSKRAYLNVLLGLINLENRIGRKVEINVFGMDRGMRLPAGKNIGLLNHEELTRLYQESHFGIVASATNISFVTLEMIASGLPVIEFHDGSFPAFFGNQKGFLFGRSADDLFQQIQYCCTHQSELNRTLREFQQIMKDWTWEHASHQLEQFLREGIARNASRSYSVNS